MNTDLRGLLISELRDSAKADAVLALFSAWLYEMSQFYPDVEHVEILRGLSEYVLQKVPYQS